MSAAASTGVDRPGGVGFSLDVGEINSLPQAPTSGPVSRAHLLPGEEAASLPLPSAAPPSAISPLTRFLGPLLTVANPVWTNEGLPRMRRLQKKLVEHSLTLPEEDRSDCMAAISVVENAVQLRLRLQQMRMSDAEMNIKDEDVATP